MLRLHLLLAGLGLLLLFLLTLHRLLTGLGLLLLGLLGRLLGHSGLIRGLALDVETLSDQVRGLDLELHRLSGPRLRLYLSGLGPALGCLLRRDGQREACRYGCRRN